MADSSLNKKLLAKQLAALIRKRRRALGITQEQLGKHAGCGVVFIYQLETGKYSIRLDKLIDVLDVLGLQLKIESGKSGLEVKEDQ